MVLTLEEMLALCEKPRNKPLIDSCVALQNEHKRHVTGEGYKMLITFHEGYETDRQKKIKETMAQPATLPITKIILDELNRWTNAQGTYKAYDFGGKKSIEDRFIKEVLGQIWRNRPIDAFITNEYKEALDIEFCSFLTVVKPKVTTTDDGVKMQDREGIVSKMTGDYARPYIIFTSINDVIDFVVYGNRVEYIIMKFKTEVIDGKKIQYYRAIDDEKDVVIRMGDDRKYSVADDYEVYYHELNQVPSIQVSTLKKDILVDGLRKSQITFLIPSLNRYLAMDAEHMQSEIIHGHPQRWAVQQKCPLCEGEGEVFNDPDKTYYKSSLEDGVSMACPRCGGVGGITTTDSNEVVGLPQFDEEGKPYPLEAPAGYINFNTDILDHQSQELVKLANDIVYAGTSNKNIVADRFKTATEANSNTKTLEDKIDDRLRVVEEVETFLTDTAAKLDDEFRSDYKGCSIKYGRNLYYRNENDIIEEVKKGKEAGMPMSYIKSLVIELYKTKYRNSQAERERYLRLTELEPFPGYTITELVKLPFPVDPFELNFKLNFNDLIEEYERINGSVTLKPVDEVLGKLIQLNNPKYEKAKESQVDKVQKDDI